MKPFFGPDLLLSSETARHLYKQVQQLPIIDYHCHLNEREIATNQPLGDLGTLWLQGDHYKWRAMRLCGVQETYITGDASYYEKYLAYARIFPQLCGSPLYYWTQMELSMLFDIHEPLGPDTAESIWEQANRVLKNMTVGDILTKCRVQYVATTDDPTSSLAHHGSFGHTRVAPTFRPDRMLSLDAKALAELAEVSQTPTDTLDGCKQALRVRLEYFRAHGCLISDHGMDWLPVADCGDQAAAALYARRSQLTEQEKHTLFSHLLYFLAGLYAEADMVMQIHFATFRNVNTACFPRVGRDAGFDIMRGEVNVDRLVTFFDTLQQRDQLPKVVLYSLNPTCVPALATLSGAFPRVRVGAAWWFNDTLSGIRRQLETVAEYAALGTHLGMLTDSRSFASYIRFDFFRRILADFVAGYVERGEYDQTQAEQLMRGICYDNIRAFLGLPDRKEA